MALYASQLNVSDAIIRTSLKRRITMSTQTKKLSNRRSLGCRMTLALTLFATVQGTFTGCKTVPVGRCGIPDQCAPAVVRDPFPNDVGVPSKGVDPETAGYYRPRWRVLNGQPAECCTEQCAAPSQLIEVKEEGRMPTALPQTYSLGSNNRIKTIPVSTNHLLPVNASNTPLDLPAAISPSKTYSAFSSEIAPIVLPAPLTVPVNEHPSPLTPSPIQPELAPVLTR